MNEFSKYFLDSYCYSIESNLENNQNVISTMSMIQSDHKPYRCPEPSCMKTFKEKGNLKTHSRIHVNLS